MEELIQEIKEKTGVTIEIVYSHQELNKLVASKSLNDSYNVLLVAVGRCEVLRVVRSYDFLKIAPFLNNLKGLRFLYCESDCIRSFKPEFIDKLDELVNISLTHCQLTEVNIAPAESIRSINFAFNFLKEFPKSICNCKNIINIDLASNSINKVPKEIKRLKKLEVLHLDFNEIDSPEILGELNLKVLTI